MVKETKAEKPKKPKTKKSLLNTICTEVSSGTYEFEAGRFKWRWFMSAGGTVNLVLLKDGKEYALLHFSQLTHAVAFAWGFESGCCHLERMAEEKSEEAE